MASNFNSPVVTDNYATLLPALVTLHKDLAMGLDPALTGTSTNLPTGAKRFNEANNTWERFNGTSWAAMSSLYSINISGNAATATTAAACSGNAATATKATHLSAGAAGAVPYQTAAGATGYTAVGTAGQVLTSAGAGTPIWTTVQAFPAGTRMPFAQAAAPTGWTQDTSDAANNRMLRVVSSAGNGVGGSHSPILNSVVPSHTHGFTTGSVSADHTHSITNTAHSHTLPGNYYKGPGTGGSYGAGASSSSLGSATDSTTPTSTAGGISANHTHSGSTDNGSSQTNWTPRYIDMIICSKN